MQSLFCINIQFPKTRDKEISTVSLASNSPYCLFIVRMSMKDEEETLNKSKIQKIVFKDLGF